MKDETPQVERKRILVSDDSRDMTTAMQYFLDDAGYEARTSNDTLETMALARSWQPDAITTDIMGPGMDGIEMIRPLKADALTRGIPVVVISSAARMDGVSERALEAGARSVLAKPVEEWDDVLCLVRDALGE